MALDANRGDWAIQDELARRGMQGVYRPHFRGRPGAVAISALTVRLDALVERDRNEPKGNPDQNRPGSGVEQSMTVFKGPDHQHQQADKADQASKSSHWPNLRRPLLAVGLNWINCFRLADLLPIGIRQSGSRDADRRRLRATGVH